VFVGTFLLNWYLNEVKGLEPDLIGTVEPSWHRAAADKGLTRTMAKC
jgi:hypothetical protein